MMHAKSKREQIRARRRNQRTRGYLIWGGLGLVTLVVIGILVWQAARRRPGEAMAVMQSPHVPTDSDPGAYNSDPPTSGPHYDGELDAGFYETSDRKYPAGFLVHNLEHGYVIFWYNCAGLAQAGCGELKAQIRSVMDQVDQVKVIAYPWDSIDVPVVITSWGRLLKMPAFDSAQALAFYRANLNHAPEPNAP